MTPMEQANEVADAIRAAVPGATAHVRAVPISESVDIAIHGPSGQHGRVRVFPWGDSTYWRHPPFGWVVALPLGEQVGSASEAIYRAVRFLLDSPP